MMNVSAETNEGTDDGAVYTVWVDGAIITGFMGNHRDATSLANKWRTNLAIWWGDEGYSDVTLVLENADLVYGI